MAKQIAPPIINEATRANGSSTAASTSTSFRTQMMARVRPYKRNGFPLYISGDSKTGGGHAWVCDGFDEDVF